MSDTTDFVTKHAITMGTVTSHGPRTEDGYETWHYTVPLLYAGKSFDAEIGYGNPTTQPEADDVLDNYISDGWGTRVNGTLEEWASDYDMDPRAPRTQDIYQACARAWRQLADLLGEKLATDLATNYERL